MKNQAQTTATVNALNLLISYARQRPGLDFNDYGDRYYYNKESREITKDLHDFKELLKVARSLYYDNELTALIEQELKNSSGRLTLTESGKLQYITGQYWPTEYRPACSNILRVLIWRYFMNEKNAEGAPLYATGHEIRKKIRSLVSRRVASNYFN